MTGKRMQALDYNVPGGKLNRGMAVADVYRAIKEGQVTLHTEKCDVCCHLLITCQYSEIPLSGFCNGNFALSGPLAGQRTLFLVRSVL